MSLAQALQIHSDYQAEPGPVKIKINKKEKKKVPIYIGKDNAKKFLILSSLALLLFMLPFIFSAGLLVIRKGNKNRLNNKNGIKRYADDFYKENDTRLTNPYGVLSMVLLPLTLTLVSVFPKLGRKRFRLFFGPIIYFTAGYLCILITLDQRRILEFSKGNLMVCLFICLIFFNAALSNFISALVTNRKPKSGLPMLVSFGFVISEIVYIRFFEKFSTMEPAFYFIVIMIQLFVTVYFVKDQRFMVTHRYDFYLADDWFLGFVHLLTDIFFVFWHNFYIKREEIETEDPEIPDLDIHIVKDNKGKLHSEKLNKIQPDADLATQADSSI